MIDLLLVAFLVICTVIIAKTVNDCKRKQLKVVRHANLWSNVWGLHEKFTIN